MTKGLSIVHRDHHLSRQDMRQPGIACPVTFVGDEPPFGPPSCDFRVVGNSVGNSVGNFSRHPAQMPPAPKEGFAPQRDAVDRPFLSQYAAGRALWRRGPSASGPLHGGVRDDDRPQARGAGLSRLARGKATALRMSHACSRERPSNEPYGRRHQRGTCSRLCRFGVASASLAIVLYGGYLSALAGPTTSGRQSAGRAAPLNGLTLRLEEVQMDRWLQVSGASLGHDDGPIGVPRGRGVHTVTAPVEEGPGRSQRPGHGPT